MSSFRVTPMPLVDRNHVVLQRRARASQAQLQTADLIDASSQHAHRVRLGQVAIVGQRGQQLFREVE